MKLKIRPLTPSLWPALEALFGKGGASNGCWCMYWRIGPGYHKRPREKNKRAFQRIVKRGPPPGLLAFDGNRPVGWCQLTPREDLSWLNHKPRLRPLDDLPVWAVSCFYIRRGYRRRGVMTALIVEALKAAKRAMHRHSKHTRSTLRYRAVRATCSQGPLPRSGASDSGPSPAASPPDQSCATI